MSKRFLSGINVTGTATLNTVANAGLDTDKFLVLDAAGNIDFRTGDELKIDIGANVVSRIEHEVKLGETMSIGTPVYVGVDLNAGTNMTVYKASNATEAKSSKTMGLVASSGITNDLVEVITEGLLEGLNTSTATKGDPVWLGVDGALIFGLANKPVAPAHLVSLGVVTRVQSNNGEIFVKVQNGFEMNEIHNYLEGSVQNNQVIVYESATSLYKPKSISTILGFTPSDDSSVVKLAGAQVITGAKSFDAAITVNAGIGFLNGVMPNITSNLYSGIGGNSQGISIVTRPVSTNYTNNLYFATSNNSFTFPNATGTIALTSDLTAYVPSSRTITINGTTYDLSANRAWTITTDASARTILRYVATANQTTFTISGGYTPGLTDVYRNGVKLDNSTDFTATNGTTIVLTNGASVNDVIEVYRYQTAFLANNALRVVTEFTATAGQTTFNVTYNSGLVDVFYNGSKLLSTEYAAGNGTTIVLNFPCNLNDTLEVHAYSYAVGAFTGQAQLNGTGFVKVSGTTVTYDNSTYLTTSSASSTYLPLTGGTLTGALSGTSATFSGNSFLATSSGDVGMGTTTPNLTAANRKVLDINGTTESLISFSSGGTNKSYIFNDGTNLIMQGATLKLQTGFTDRVTITSGGTLLVNATTSTYGAGLGYSFGVRGTNSQTLISIALANQTLDTQGVYIGLDASVGYINMIDNKPWTFGTNNTERMRITSSGNLLLGTTSDPGYGRTTASVYAATGGIMQVAGSSTTALFYVYQPNNTAYIGTTTNHDFAVISNNATRLTISSTGTATLRNRLGVGISTDESYASIFVGGDVTTGVNQYAILADPQLSGTSNSYALFANARIKASTAVTNAFGVYIPSAEKLSGASITNNYALYIANQTSGSSTNYSIYSSGGLNYFGGNVGIGTSSPSERLHVNTASGDNTLLIQAPSSNYSQIFLGRASSGSPSYAGYIQYYHVNDSLTLGTNAQPRMTITSGGFTKMTSTGSVIDANGTYHEVRSNSNDTTLYVLNQAGAADGVLVNLNTNGTTYNFFRGYSNAAAANRIIIYTNGNVVNANGSYGAISDIKLKENITDTTPKLKDLLKVKVRNYNFKNTDNKQIGVIAQELEEIFPSMIDISPDRDSEGNDLGTTTKSVKYSVFVPMLIKAIQEQQAQIEELTEKVNALENK